jgi:hypothetical protein
MWYNNNCHAAVMLAKENDEYFEDVALPVDIFHQKTKHAEDDAFCGRNCNAVIWHELINDAGGWTFNSSAAEQVNLWIGGYYAIARLMCQDR